jgi:hypothetical protein
MQSLFYAYQKLDTPSSFRLLHIERPGPSDDTKAAWVYSLTRTNFDQAPPYETLSYVWGTTDRSELVKLRDGKLLRVTKPLKDALSFVVEQGATGHLWIDQICIDQDDRIERGNQVKIMGQIYSSCSRVLVWLGQITKFDTERSSKDGPVPVHPLQDTLVQKSSFMRHLKTRLRKLTASGESSSGSLCHGILQSPWFQRAWIFQEIVLPPSALFILAMTWTIPDQTLLMSLPELHTMIDRESMGTDIEDTVSDTIRIMYARWDERHGIHSYTSSPIEQTLSLLTARAKTSEEIDQLYAFFGLNLDNRINLSPSYDSSLEIAMIDTAASIIEGTCSLDLFEVIPRAAEHTRNNIRIPTWTPDFRKEHLVIPFRRSQSDLRQLTQSLPHLRPNFVSSTCRCTGEEKRTIHARGFALDDVDIEVGTLSSRTAHETHLDALLKRSLEAWNKIKWSVEKEDPPPPRDRHELTTLIASTNDLGFAPVPDKGRLCRALAAEGCCAVSDEYPRERLPDPIPDSLRKIYPIEAMVHVMRGRTLWMTRSGRFVLGSYLRRGDHVCLVYGCTNPIALRSEQDMCKVLGTCFLEGWMDPWSTRKIVEVEEALQPTVFHMM